jgi:mannan endo-1,4-beta-mannosidase
MKNLTKKTNQHSNNQLISLFRGISLILIIAGSLLTVRSYAQTSVPANKNASPEARALLDLFYRISGKYLLTGQHNDPDTKDWNSRFAANYIGKTPVIWSSDMGFAKDGDPDSYHARPDIVKEAIRQHKKGSIITICWHAVPPTADEPVTFQPQKAFHPDSLASVQGRLPENQFREILTPGTRLYNRWAAQVDSVAFFLRELRDAGVPVLWRPYHEMNGDWFWWGGRVGEYSTADLYRQLYDRLVNYHKLNNLIWIWSVDRPTLPIRKFSNFYPGSQYLDILALDVYGSDFNQAYYDSLMVLSKGKPIVLGEVGNPPSIEILKKQPNWAYWVVWAGMTRNTSMNQYHEFKSYPGILFKEDALFSEIMNPYRKACGQSPMPLKPRYPVDFTGRWVFDESSSSLGKDGSGTAPMMMDIDQDDEMLLVRKILIGEFGMDQIIKEDLSLEGTETKTEFYKTPGTIKAIWNEEKKCIEITSVVIFGKGAQSFEFKSHEEWSLLDGGKKLKNVQTSTGFQGGENTVSLIFNRM